MAKSKFLLQSIFFLLWCTVAIAQDTVFVQKHSFKETVNNLDGDGRNLIVRTVNHAYLLGSKGFEEIRGIDLTGGRYTWLRTVNQQVQFSTFNTSQIAGDKQVKSGSLGELLPGAYYGGITKGQTGNRIFVTYKGSVLEYEINSFYTLAHKGKSVRCVYNDARMKITATYSGVFIDSAHWIYSETPTVGGDYSNGEVSRINDKYYLCKDFIMVLENMQWRRIDKSISSPAYRKLNTHQGDVFYLSDNSVGVIDLETGVILDTIFQQHGVLYDMKWMNNQLVVASEDGNLYCLPPDKKVQKIFVGSSVYDINVSDSTAILSCRDGIYKFDLQTKKVNKLFHLEEAVQSVYFGKDLLISTFSGLFVVHNQSLFNLIPHVEFNKLGLSVWDGKIFVGSVEGLYVIDGGRLLYDIIPGLTPFERTQRTPQIYIYVLLISLVILFGVLYFTIRKRQKTLKLEVIRKTKITPEGIRAVMLENENLISVEAIADYFKTSTVQLNRILKRHNTSGLNLLKEIKKEIVLSMLEKKSSLDQISQRVGYSGAYIKRNYLREMD